MLTTNKGINKLHWARTIKGHHSDDIFKATGAKVFQIALHTGRFQLENTGGFGTLQKFIRFLVIERNAVKINVIVIHFTDHTQGVINHRKIGKTQKVHLKKT